MRAFVGFAARHSNSLERKALAHARAATERLSRVRTLNAESKQMNPDTPDCVVETLVWLTGFLMRISVDPSTRCIVL